MQFITNTFKRFDLSSPLTRRSLIGVGVLAALAVAGLIGLQFARPHVTSLTCTESGRATLCTSQGIGTLHYYTNGLDLYTSQGWVSTGCKDAVFAPGDVVKAVVEETGETLAATCGGFTSQCAADGRLNNNCDAPVLVYCSPEKVEVYQSDSGGRGKLVLSMTGDEIRRKREAELSRVTGLAPGLSFGSPASGAISELVQVAEADGILLYAGATGIMRVTASTGDALYSLQWDTCQPLNEQVSSQGN